MLPYGYKCLRARPEGANSEPPSEHPSDGVSYVVVGKSRSVQNNWRKRHGHVARYLPQFPRDERNPSVYEPRVHLLRSPIFLCLYNADASPMRSIDNRVRAGLVIDFLDFEVGRGLPLQGRFEVGRPDFPPQPSSIRRCRLCRVS